MTGDRILDPLRLAALRRLSLLDSPAEPNFDRLTRLASKILKAPASLITFIDEDRQFIKSGTGLPEPWASARETPLSHSFCKHMVATGQPLIVENAPQHPIVHNNLAISDLGVMAYAGIPLVIPPQGQVIGSFCVVDVVPRVWTDEEIEILQDLAASVMTEITLRSAYETEKKLREHRDEFMSMLSHDFRTPLTVIRSATDILRNYFNRLTDEQRLKYLDSIESQVQRQLDLLEDVLIMNQSDSVGLDFHPVPSDLEGLCLKLVDEFQFTFKKTHSIIFSSAADHLTQIPIDEKLLNRALSNLLSNAIKYSPQGGTIQMRLSFSPEAAIIIIQDEGLGVPEEELKHLFEPFYRGKNSLSIQGTGLGLVIVQQMIAAHSGAIDVASEIGVGTTFTITLPIPQPVDTQSPK